VTRELAAGFDLDTAHTESPEHAISLSAEAARERSHAAVAVLGGDGAVNEAANGLAGTDTPLAPLPGGRTNVFCRIVGVPDDPFHAAERLRRVAEVARADGRRRSGGAPSDGGDAAGDPPSLPTRCVDLGTMNRRHFTFASGVGLTAVANHRLNSHGVPGQRLGGAVFALEALATSAGYLRRPPRLAVEVGGRTTFGLSLVAQNADPLSYLGRRPLPLCEGAGLETGDLSLAVLHRVTVGDALAVALRVVAGQGSRALRSSDAMASLPAVADARVRTLDERPLPVEVDGDYVGEVAEIEYGAVPRALSVVVAGAGGRFGT
jgi:diacylglycerol kinase family enzyme